MMTLRAFAALFEEFRAASWAAWLAVLDRITPLVRELFVAAGRGSGKSRIVALIACAFAAREYKRAPGERIFVGIFAPDRKQAGVTFGYVLGLLRMVPELASLIEREGRESVELSNGVTIEVLTASTAAPRGRSYALAIVEEAAFLPQDSSANPDVELIRALRPGLARVPGSLLAVVSSPYARRGVLWEAARRHAGKPDGRVVFVQAATLELNPTFDRAAVEVALEEDPAGAAAEYNAQFRTDVESFVSPEAVELCTVAGRLELAPRPGVTYEAFLDFAGGSGQDSATLAVGHVEERDGQRVAVLDGQREFRPPFSPDQISAAFAAFLRPYGTTSATADRYAAEFAVEAMRRHDVTLVRAERTKSDIYRELLPLLNSGRVELLDVARLRAQLLGLERRTARGGRDSIDHAPGQHDDVANAAAGVLTTVAREERSILLFWPEADYAPASVAGAPVLYVCGVRVTERDVRDCLAGMPDEFLERYERGQLPASEAYQMAKVWKRQRMELAGAFGGQFG